MNWFMQVYVMLTTVKYFSLYSREDRKEMILELSDMRRNAGMERES